MEIGSVVAPALATTVASYLFAFQRKTAGPVAAQQVNVPRVPIELIGSLGTNVPLGQSITTLWDHFAWPLANVQSKPVSATFQTFQGQS